METKTQFEKIADDARSYLDAREQLFKLKMTERASHVTANFMSWFFIFLFLLVAFIFLSITLAHFLGELLGHEYAGYLSVTFIYGVVCFVLVKFRNGVLVKPIKNGIIKQLLNKDQDGSD